MGEFLVSKAGIGYLILYGTQVFNLTLVMSGIVLILILAFLIYQFITYIEKTQTKLNLSDYKTVKFIIF